MEEQASEIQLGGNIQLSGFHSIDNASMIVLKKIVGNRVKKFSQLCNKFELLHLTLKPVHQQGEHGKFNIHAKLMDNGSAITAEVTDLNLFMSLDKALKKCEHEIKKEMEP